MKYTVSAAVAAVMSLSTAALAESRTYDLPPFDSVSISAGVTAIVEVGGAQSVTAEAPSAAVLNRLEVDVRNRRLEISIEWDLLGLIFNVGQRDQIVVRVSAPQVVGADANSGADVDVKGMRLKMTPSVKGLDPGDPVTKAKIKASIAAAIVNEVGGSTLADVVPRVEKEYERLLVGAVVLTYIPSLTGGQVRHAVRQLVKGRAAVPAFAAAGKAVA